jgi:tRNA-splicing ligase RtcB
MDPARCVRVGPTQWRIEPFGAMRVPAVIFADRPLLEAMDDKVFEQVTNVATLPGIVEAAFALPDAHWGYGFPIGGVAAFDAQEGGVVSAGGVGFDISCGVRLLTTGLAAGVIEAVKDQLGDALFRSIPAGVGSTSHIRLDDAGMDAMLRGGARWAVARGYGRSSDLERIEERGCVDGARPDAVSAQAKARQRDEMGTLGSGNHYLEVQEVAEVYDEAVASALGLRLGDAVISIHCGSRGMGHQIGTEFLREMAIAAPEFGLVLPDIELACAPIGSDLGQRYLGAMRAATNCALANRQILTHFVRQTFATVMPEARIDLVFDVSHNICKEETHRVAGQDRRLFVHRKGATRALGPGHPDLPETLRAVGQPVFIGGSMGTGSHVMVGVPGGHAFASACHGAGRSLSRHQALKHWRGRKLVHELYRRGIVVRSPSLRGVAEEAPGAYKDVDSVVDAAAQAGLARKVARLAPRICIKG